MHHVVPRAQGGRNSLDNLVSLCRMHHITAHGGRVVGINWTAEEIDQACVEYISDYYAYERYGGI
jgi:hypothetical protein